MGSHAESTESIDEPPGGDPMPTPCTAPSALSACREWTSPKNRGSAGGAAIADIGHAGSGFLG
jgi:hypothetical protein